MKIAQRIAHSMLVLALLVPAAALVAAQGPGPQPGEQEEGGRRAFRGMNPVIHLRMALRRAGAPELSTQQEEDIRSLLQSRHQERPEAEEGAGFRSARSAYEQAVLAGDLAGAQAQAATLGQFMAEHAAQRFQDEAELKIEMLKILTPAQVDTLKENLGSSGLFRVLGPGGGPGRAHRF